MVAVLWISFLSFRARDRQGRDEESRLALLVLVFPHLRNLCNLWIKNWRFLLRAGIMELDEILKRKRAEILRIAARHGAHNVRLFGSAARAEADAASDIDILVDMAPDRSLLDLGALWRELNDLLGVKVDVVTEKGLRDRIRDRVLKEAVSF